MDNDFKTERMLFSIPIKLLPIRKEELEILLSLRENPSLAELVNELR